MGDSVQFILLDENLFILKKILFSYMLIRQLTVWTKSYNLEIHGFGFFMKLSNIIKNDAKIKIKIEVVKYYQK